MQVALAIIGFIVLVSLLLWQWLARRSLAYSLEYQQAVNDDLMRAVQAAKNQSLDRWQIITELRGEKQVLESQHKQLRAELAAMIAEKPHTYS